MTKDENKRATLFSRRDFLAGAATVGAAVALAGSSTNQAFSAILPNQTRPLDMGGIAPEHFEAARQRAAAMVAKMTLDEKVSQFGSTAPAVPRIGLSAYDYGGGEGLHGLSKSGPITSLPLPLAMGCSWNRSLIQEAFTAISDEAWAWHKKTGNSLSLFSPPTVNMGTRDPRWGRIAENYSEDPYLIGELATYTIHGMQGNDTRYLKVTCSTKHYIANDTESDRERTSATVDARSFWEYYTRGFEACVRDGHTFAVMSSYNALNGIPATANRFLLTELLRDRWGFRGYVVSDCGAVGDIFEKDRHHFVPTGAEAAALAVNAGCDVDCGDTMQKYLGEAVQKMLISESTLDTSLTRAFTARVLLGEFDPPQQNPYSRTPISCLDSPAHRQLALEAARQSVVLFKNEKNTLPLDKKSLKTIAVIGPMAGQCQLGNYSGGPQFMVSPLKAMNEYFGIPAAPTYSKNANDFSQFGTVKGPKQLGGHPNREGSHEGGENLQDIYDGDWATCPDVLFTGATEFHARIASDATVGTIEAHLDSLDGPLIAKLDAPLTGGGQTWLNISVPLLKPVSGVHTVFLRFRGETSGSLFKITSFSLTPAPLTTVGTSAGTKVIYTLGCGVVDEKDPALFSEAVKAAKEADVALVFVGVNEQVDKESMDRSYIHLSGAQHDLVRAVYAANPKTILVISSNAPVAINWEQDNLPAIVGGHFLGEQQGHALVDVLFGNYNPGGKVGTTWYRSVEDLPDFHDYNVRNGRTYMYFQGKPLYPFGFGLSYTEFQYKNLRLSSKTLAPDGKVTVSFEVTNSGHRDGDEIVQLYVHCSGGTVQRPIRQLVNFDRVHIKAGETQTVRLELPQSHNALRYWDESKNEFVVTPGTVDVLVGASSADVRLKDTLQLTDSFI
ncbi:MAG: glycoside hydrolase family 3 C-terminal domain-containing protein [Acidobacteriaceae bacterium]